jgi:hypothetical protein
MAGVWLDWVWFKTLPAHMKWSRARCVAYIVTLSLAPLHAIIPKRIWLVWYLSAPSARGVLLVLSQVEAGGRFEKLLCVLVAATLTSINPPFADWLSAIHRWLAIVYSLGFLVGLCGANKLTPLRLMLSAMALCEVVYFTGGWAWEFWWLFPGAQALIRLVAWGLNAKEAA